MQFSADEDVLKSPGFFKKFEKVTESKIPKQGPKTKMQTTGAKWRQKGGWDKTHDRKRGERKGDEEELWEDRLGCYTQMELVAEEAARKDCVNHVICSFAYGHSNSARFLQISTKTHVTNYPTFNWILRQTKTLRHYMCNDIPCNTGSIVNHLLWLVLANCFFTKDWVFLDLFLCNANTETQILTSSFTPSLLIILYYTISNFSG